MIPRFYRARTLTVSLAARAPPGPARALSAPSIAHDGRLVACSGKDLLGFEANGSFAWIVPLGHMCNDSISPVFEGEQVTHHKSEALHDLTEYMITHCSYIWNGKPGMVSSLLHFTEET
jgi:hypothetical protein